MTEAPVTRLLPARRWMRWGLGVLGADHLALNWQWVDLSFDAFAPSLQAALPAQLSGVLTGTGEARVTRPSEASAADRTQLTLSALSLKNFSLAVPGPAKNAPLLALAALNLDVTKLDTAARKANLGALKLDVLKLIVPKAKTNPQCSRQWTGQLTLAPLAASGRLTVDRLPMPFVGSKRCSA